MLCLMMENELMSIHADIEKDPLKGLEMTEVNDKEKLTLQVPLDILRPVLFVVQVMSDISK